MKRSVVRKACRVLGLYLSLAALVPAELQAAEAPPAQTRRFVLAVGANEGGQERALLRYAFSDAGAFARVMRELGGVLGDDGVLLEQPDRALLATTFAALGDRMRKARDRQERVEFLFYYSGHSDEIGLRLREDLIPYKEVRGWIDGLPADVRIGVLDSCASGNMTRLKGGKRRPPFLVDASSAVRGHAFLTSSSESEAAQESDRIRASFFTHYLVSGLRGAADVSGDGQVTLSEAYRFAFDETLARTEATSGGAQHPAYDIRLAGTGDVVMTDLRETSATLAIDPAIEGRVFIRDSEGRLAAELYKPTGRAIELGLSPGKYAIRVERPELFARAEVTLAERVRTTLGPEALVPDEREPAVVRGNPNAAVDRGPADVAEDVAKAEGYTVVPFAFTLVSPDADTNAAVKGPVKNSFALTGAYGRVAAVDGMQLGFGVQRIDDSLRGMQLTLAANVVSGDVDGMQVSIGYNGAETFVEGLQASVGANWAGGRVEGAQATVGANIAGDVRGLQASAGANVAGHLYGLQASAAANVAAQVDGLQVAVSNTADELDGLQIGVANVVGGRAGGLQVGVFNYADDADAQIGVLSLSKKHGVSGQVWVADTGIYTALRLNAAYTHSLLSIGWHPAGDDDGISLGLGYGVHVPLPAGWFVELDATFYTVLYDYSGIPFDGEDTNLVQARLMARYAPMEALSFFFGPTFNLLSHQQSDDHGRRPGLSYTSHRTEVGDSTELAMWPGAVVGLQFF